MRGRGHIFDDLAKLSEMLSLRMTGHGPSELAEKYGVDHSTIIYHCKREGVQIPGKRGVVVGDVEVQAQRTRIVIRGAQAMVVIDFDGQRINPGKTYAEYLEEEQKRGKRNLL